MTVQEINIRNALKIANTWLSEVQYGAPCFGCGEMEAIKDALEKQISKKVVEKTLDCYCPKCRGMVDSYNDWCGNCGQKLDWGE